MYASEDEFRPHHIHAVTIGQHGSWAIELTWTDESGEPFRYREEGKLEGADNIAADLWAAQQAIRVAIERKASVTIYSTNASSVDTANTRLAAWEVQGWKTGRGSSPAHLNHWQNIADLSRKTQVEWRKRKEGELDEGKLYDELVGQIEDRRNQEAMERAIDRDRS